MNVFNRVAQRNCNLLNIFKYFQSLHCFMDILTKRSVKELTLFTLTNGHSRQFKFKKLCWVTDFTHELIN
jgi:hypothetical protein